MEFFEVQDIKIPVIGLGTWNLRGRECVEAIISALEIGYRHLDTAQMYDNESEVGEAIIRSSLPRKDIFLTTKVWSSNLRYNDVISSLNESLNKLKTDYVDLFLIHWPNSNVPLNETLKAMEDLHTQGKVKCIGVSNFDTDLLKRARQIARLPITNIQVEYHPFLSQDPLLDYCQKNNISFTAYCPLARGRNLDHPTLVNIAKKHNKTVPQVILRWLIQQKNVIAIPKSANPNHQKLNFNIFDFQLSPGDMQDIFHLNQGQRLVKK